MEPPVVASLQIPGAGVHPAWILPFSHLGATRSAGPPLGPPHPPQLPRSLAGQSSGKGAEGQHRCCFLPPCSVAGEHGPSAVRCPRAPATVPLWAPRAAPLTSVPKFGCGAPPPTHQSEACRLAAQPPSSTGPI